MTQRAFYTDLPRRQRRPVPAEAAGIAIFVVDEEPVASRTLYVNEAFVRMSGYTAEQLVGHSALLLLGARPTRADLDSAVGLAFPWSREETKMRPDGSTYRVEVSLEALPRTTGRPQHVVLTQRRIRAKESSRPADPFADGSPRRTRR